MKDFDRWNVLKKGLDKRLFNHYFHEREVWWCSVGINVGNEIDGKKNIFGRPVLIIKKFNKTTALIVPLSSSIIKHYYNFSFSHEGRNYSARLSQVRVISTSRLVKIIYTIDRSLFDQIISKIKAYL